MQIYWVDLSLAQSDDCWLWKSDVNGNISTRSTYRLLSPSSRFALQGLVASFVEAPSSPSN